MLDNAERSAAAIVGLQITAQMTLLQGTANALDITKG